MLDLCKLIFIIPSEVPVLEIGPSGYYDDVGSSKLGCLIIWSVLGGAIDFFYYLLGLSEQLDYDSE